MTSEHRAHPDAGRHGETAAHYIAAAVPRGLPGHTATQAVSALSGHRYESVTLFCVTDADGRLLGVIRIADLLAAPPETRLEELMWRDAPRVHADVDQERIASLALHHVLNAIPVVDHNDFLLGVIPSEALLHILRLEHVEDIHHIAGIRRETTRAREAIESPPMRRVRDRLPWLLLGLVGSIFATWVVAYYEQALKAHVAIAFFVPGLVYLADAIGTQTEAVAVRGLSLSHAKLSTLVGGELRTGLMIGLILGAVTFPLVWLIFGDLRLASGVALALFCAGGVATTIGLLLPWLLDKLGTDPAYGSGPLATVIQDVLSLLIYFAIVSSTVL
ncbi:MAG: magnesium transporter [Gallionella sp.]|nr:magnesium transporter [Gallionella sp.]